MKTRLLLLLAANAFFVACSNEEVAETSTPMPKIQKVSSIRSYEEALQIAQSSIQMVDGQAQTRAASPRKIALNESKVCKLDAKTRTSSDLNDTLMYVFNFEDNQGFSIISANKNTEALIAVTEKGHYDPSVRSNNEGFNLFMDLAKIYVANDRQMGEPGGGLDPLLELKDSIVTFSGYVGPFIEVKWGQEYPEGMFCPNGISGCCNTAMAQVMTYFEYPTGISLTYSGADQSYQALNWSNIKLHAISNHAPNSFYDIDEATHKAIGRLCRQLGELSNSTYYQDNTETYDNDVKQTMTQLGYTTNNWTDYSSGVVTASITNCHPVLIYGFRIKYENGNPVEVGHAWVVDGYYYSGYESFTWSRPYNGFDWELIEHVVSTDYYHHFNWGYSGDNNGYYITGVFDMCTIHMPDDYVNSNYSDRNYNLDVKIMSVYR